MRQKSGVSSALMFFDDLKSCMLWNVKRQDNVTTAESNPIVFRFAIIDSMGESILIDSNEWFPALGFILGASDIDCVTIWHHSAWKS